MTSLLTFRQYLALAAIVVAYIAVIRQLRKWERLEKATRQYKADTAPDERRFVMAVRSSVKTPIPEKPLPLPKRVA